MAKLRITILTLALLTLVLPATVVAQDATPLDIPLETEPGGTQLDLGQEVVDGIVVGATYVRETYGDWEMRCVRTNNETDPCQLYQLMLDDDGNSVAEISLFELPTGQAAVVGATIAAPLQTLLTEQITLGIDNGNTKRYPFSYCSLQGCYARIGLTAEEIEGFKRGQQASLSIVPVAAPDQRVGLILSLTGFTEGYEALHTSNAAISGKSE